MSGRPELRHAPYTSLERRLFPLVEDRLSLSREDFRVVCVVREPIERLHSWFRYRGRPALAGADQPAADRYAGGMSFDEFCEAYIERRPGPGLVRPQSDYILATDGDVGPDEVYRYENLDAAVASLERISGRRLSLQRRKESPRAPLDLSDAVRSRLVDALRPDTEIYEAAR